MEAVNWILPASAARLGVQISGAVKYPVLEVKWQQKLWLEPWNNQSRCFDCREPAKNCPGFAAARAPQTVIKPFAGKLLLLSASHYTLQTPWLQGCHDVTIMICSHALWRCQQNFTIAFTKFREGAYYCPPVINQQHYSKFLNVFNKEKIVKTWLTPLMVPPCKGWVPAHPTQSDGCCSLLRAPGAAKTFHSGHNTQELLTAAADHLLLPAGAKFVGG